MKRLLDKSPGKLNLIINKRIQVSFPFKSRRASKSKIRSREHGFGIRLGIVLGFTVFTTLFFRRDIFIIQFSFNFRSILFNYLATYV